MESLCARITLIFNKDADGIAENITASLEMLETRLATNLANSGSVSAADFAVFEFLWEHFSG